MQTRHQGVIRLSAASALSPSSATSISSADRWAAGSFPSPAPWQCVATSDHRHTVGPEQPRENETGTHALQTELLYDGESAIIVGGGHVFSTTMAEGTIYVVDNQIGQVIPLANSAKFSAYMGLFPAGSKFNMIPIPH